MEWPLQNEAAMRSDRVRRVVQVIVLSAVPLVGACGDQTGVPQLPTSESCNDSASHATITANEPYEPALELKIEDCRVDIDACADLCSYELSKAGIAQVQVNSCSVTFDGGTTTSKVSYAGFNAFNGPLGGDGQLGFEPNCPEPGAPIGTSGDGSSNGGL